MSKQDTMWPHKAPTPNAPPPPSTQPSPENSEPKMGQAAQPEPQRASQVKSDFQAETPPYMEGPRMRMGQSAPAAERRLAQPSKGSFLSAILGNDPATRKLMGGALALVILLLLIVGTWTFLRGRTKDIPIIAPPSLPVKQRPSDPGGMQIMGDDLTQNPDITGKGAVHLADLPEEPDARMLSRDENVGDANTPRNASVGNNVPNNGESTPSANMAQSLPAQNEQSTSQSALTPPPLPYPQNGNPGLKSDMMPASEQNAQQPAQKQDDVEPEKQATQQPVSSQSVAAKKPSATPTTHHKPAPEKSDKEKKAEKSTKTPKSPENHGHYKVQLAALDSEAQAKKEWASLQHKAPEIFAGHAPIYMKIEHNGHNFVRLRIGGFADSAAVKHFCAKLHAHSVACTPASF